MITSLVYANNVAPTQVTATCKQEYGQACYHYSSVIANNKQWATLTCPEAAATSANDRKDTGIVDKWSTSRNGKGWIDPSLSNMNPKCDRDEYPPVYLVDPTGPVAKDRGTTKAGQRLRVLPASENQAAAKMWTGICFTNALPDSDAAVIDAAANKRAGVVDSTSIDPTSTEYSVAITAAYRPEFTITSFDKKDYGSGTSGDGLKDNPCWPESKAPLDPGWALMTYDEYYDHYGQVTIRNTPMPKGPYNYKQPYDDSLNGKNGGQNKWAWT
ncbi:hypothetical protein N0V82_010291 [Gnomoniopsis sp. IMI 355080]|nr:hypothetical protein N0V82_010291 [Gnomoniopsis sp. IMI 355080]